MAYTDNMGFAVPELSSGRQSFSPDVSYYLGPLPFNPMRFVEGPPTFVKPWNPPYNMENGQ